MYALLSGEYVPVGHILILKFDGHILRNTRHVVFGVEFSFSKFRMEPVMLSFAQNFGV